jgi:hypothetical protein
MRYLGTLSVVLLSRSTYYDQQEVRPPRPFLPHTPTFQGSSRPRTRVKVLLVKQHMSSLGQSYCSDI